MHNESPATNTSTDTSPAADEPRAADQDPAEREASRTAEDPVPVTRTVDHGTAKLLPDIDRPRAWLLTVDGAPQSYVDLDEPTHLEFEYVRRLAHVLDEAAPPGQPLDVLHLGGGALTLPRYLAATRPHSRQDVIDVDHGLLALVTEHLPLPGNSGIALHPQDARAALEAAPEAGVDVIVADVFTGSRVPAQLTSVEYARAAARALRPHGCYAANLADSAPFDFLRRQLANFAAVFAHLALIAEPSVLRGRRFGNAVLLASHTELPIAALARRTAADVFPARVEHGSPLRRLIADASPVPDTQALPSPIPPDGTFSVA
ncbi:spermidine synthase [Streptomyces sp. RGM 3693]|uniref:spermidine synthase n=1 Tax=Streptomyces sp. RGM 3693 TaxID=3413284 RepID=UPI003D2DB390